MPHRLKSTAISLAASALMLLIPAAHAELPAPSVQVVNPQLLSGIKRVAVASFTVQYVEAQMGQARTSGFAIGSAGVALADRQSQSRAVGVDFSHALDRERMQSTTEQIYQSFIRTLQSAGLEVVPHETVARSSNFQRILAAGTPTPRQEDAEAEKGSGEGAVRSVFFTPAGLPLIVKAGGGNESIDYLNKGDSLFSSHVMDHTLTFTGRLKLYTASFRDYERDLEKELNAATLHVRVFVPLAKIEVDGGMNWVKARIEPGVMLGKRFTRMTVGVPSGYSYVLLKEPLAIPGVIEYTVEEKPSSNPLRAMLGEKEKSYISTMNVENYWQAVPAASEHVFQSFAKVLLTGQP